MISTPYYKARGRAVKPSGLVIDIQGALVTAHGSSPTDPADTHICGVRAAVSDFSPASRRRLQQVFCSLGGDVMLSSWFASLTWDDTCIPDGPEVKRCIDVLSKRLLRAFPSMCVIWKVEVQSRKSGAFVGRPVPHLHLVIVSHSDTNMLDFHAWLRLAWHEVVGTVNPAHLGKGGCHIEHAYGSLRKVSWYVSKYTSKSGDPQLLASFGWIGRWWGILNRKQLPLAAETQIILEGQMLVEFNRLVRGWLSRSRSGRRYARRLARQSTKIGYCLMGIPSAEVHRMVYHAVDLANSFNSS